MPTVLRFRNCYRWSGLSKHWPPRSSVSCLTGIACKSIFWDLEAQPPLQPLPGLEFWGLLLMQLFPFMTKKGVEDIGAPVWKGTLPAQTHVYSHKKKLLESLIWTLLLCVVNQYSLSLWGIDEYCSLLQNGPAYKPHHHSGAVSFCHFLSNVFNVSYDRYKWVISSLWERDEAWHFIKVVRQLSCRFL